MGKNTKQHGSLRFFTYFDVAQDAYVGVCFELGIVKEEKDAESLRKELLEAAIGYVEAVGKNKLSDGLLNQRVPQEYSDIYEIFLRSLAQKSENKPMPLGIQHPNVFAETVSV